MRTREKSEIMLKIVKEFVVMWILTGIGMAIGSILPPFVSLIMSVIALLLIISTYFIKDNSKITKVFFAVPFLMGFAFYYSVSFFLQKLGGQMVLGVLILTLLMFLGLGFLGYVAIKRDLGFLGVFLLLALIVLIVASIISIFFTSYLLQLLITLGGVLIFSLYIIFDFNRIQHDNIQRNETTGYALSLYLDFINLFLYLLRLVDFFEEWKRRFIFSFSNINKFL